MTDYIAAAVACCAGAGLCYLNYIISKKFIAKYPDKFYISFIFRQLINVVFLVAVYFVSPLLNINQSYPLIGAAIGVTLPSVKFTRQLLDEQNKSGADNEEAQK